MKLLKTIIIILLLSSPVFAFQGKCVKVTDGDTIQVLDEQNKIVKVRLYGIDCPENSQAFGQKAKEFVLSQVGNKPVEVDVIDIDKYQRSVGVVKFDDKVLNEEIIKAGFAWFYAQYCKESFCDTWKELEQAARDNQTGLWIEPNPVNPADFRHGDSTNTATISEEYHGNVDSLKFHKPSCKHYNCKNCTTIFKTKQEAQEAGYMGCGICKP